jgi:hypothetical protein
MTPETERVLTLDLKHLTEEEFEWLHALQSRIQQRMWEERRKKKCWQKRS